MSTWKQNSREGSSPHTRLSLRYYLGLPHTYLSLLTFKVHAKPYGGKTIQSHTTCKLTSYHDIVGHNVTHLDRGWRTTSIFLATRTATATMRTSTATCAPRPPCSRRGNEDGCLVRVQVAPPHCSAFYCNWPFSQVRADNLITVTFRRKTKSAWLLEHA